MDDWYLEHLVCPVNKTSLHLDAGEFVSEKGRRYPVVDGMPVMLVQEAEQTQGVATETIRRARDGAADARAAHLYLESLGISEREKAGLVDLAERGESRIDPVVAYMVGATCGYTYKHLIGTLTEYPVPELRLSDGHGDSFLELGCNWGRWCIAAARKGYSVVAIDPSLGAVMAARRVARQLGLDVRYVVADARYLPFRDSRFGVVFSYSVLQHLAKEDTRQVLTEVGRVLRPGGKSLIQMPNWLGVRSFYHQARRGFRQAQRFEVRYWSVPEMKRTFEASVGPSSVSVDCYFGLGLQKSDRHLMPPLTRRAIDVSERLRTASAKLPPLKYVADSVYVAVKEP